MIHAGASAGSVGDGGGRGCLVHQPHPRRIPLEIVDEPERPLRRRGQVEFTDDLHGESGQAGLGRSSPRKARASSGERADSRPSRSSDSSKLGVHGVASAVPPVRGRGRRARARRARGRGRRMLLLADRRRFDDARSTPRRTGSAIVSAVSSSWSPADSAPVLRRRRTRCGRRAGVGGRNSRGTGSRRSSRVQCRGHDHRLGVTLTQHAARLVRVRAQRVEPEDEIFGAHAVRDRRRFGTSRSFAEPAHLPSTLAVGVFRTQPCPPTRTCTMKLARSNPTDRFGRLLAIIVLTFIVSGIGQDWATSVSAFLNLVLVVVAFRTTSLSCRCPRDSRARRDRRRCRDHLDRRRQRQRIRGGLRLRPVLRC